MDTLTFERDATKDFCTDGQKHNYESLDTWKEHPDAGPEGGLWREEEKCTKCGHTQLRIQTGEICFLSKDKKHDERERFDVNFGGSTFHIVECIKCNRSFSRPVIFDGKRPVIAKSTSELNFKNGLYQGIANGFIVKILANNNKRFGNPLLEFEVDKEISKDGESIVRIELIDKVAFITRFI